MNYNRIYEELISDRLVNSPSEEDYAEVHHIVPRCLGGSNEPSNLIRLTPEDHFFAHLLLAKCFGGWKLTGTAKLMADKVGGQSSKLTRVRRLYGQTKRLHAKTFCGSGHPMYDHRVFEFVHTNSDKRACTKFDLCAEFDLDIRLLTSVVSGSRKQTKGWTLASRYDDPKFVLGKLKGENHPLIDHTVRKWKNKDGDVFEGTSYQLSIKAGGKGNSYQRVVDRVASQTHGWFLADHYDDFPNARYTSNCAKSPIISMKHYDGRTFTGKRVEFMNTYNLRSSCLSNVISGGMLNTKGWMLPDTDPSTINIGGIPPIFTGKRLPRVAANDNVAPHTQLAA